MLDKSKKSPQYLLDKGDNPQLEPKFIGLKIYWTQFESKFIYCGNNVNQLTVAKTRRQLNGQNPAGNSESCLIRGADTVFLLAN